MATNELEQFCEIDGHEYHTYWCEYGLVIGSKTAVMTQICTNCNNTKQTTYTQGPATLTHITKTEIWE